MFVTKHILRSPDTNEGDSAAEVANAVVSPDEGNSTPDVVPASDYKALKAQFDKVQDFADRMKEAEKTERTTRQTAQKEQGEYKKLSESFETQNAELQKQLEEAQNLINAQTPVVERGLVIEQQLKDKVTARMENGLPESMKLALGGLPVVVQIAALDAFDAENSKNAPVLSKPSNPSGGPPASGQGANVTAHDIAVRVANGEAIEDIRATPEFQALIPSMNKPPVKKSGLFGNLFSGASGTRKG